METSWDLSKIPEEQALFCEIANFSYLHTAQEPPRNCISPGRAELVCQPAVAEQENRERQENKQREMLSLSSEGQF